MYGVQEFIQLGLNEKDAAELTKQINEIPAKFSPEKKWQAISQKILNSNYPFGIHLLLFSSLFPGWHQHPENAPAWIPTDDIIKTANISQFINKLNFDSVKKFHAWTVTAFEDFWRQISTHLNIQFKKNPERTCDLSQGLEKPKWFPGGELNIVDSCFQANPSQTALIYEDEKKKICHLSYGELEKLCNRIANSLVKLGFKKGDAIGIAMPMNVTAVAIYLGIIKMGGVVVSIADSFSSQEISTRLNIAKAKAIFTQDFIFWGGKKIPLYEKIKTSAEISIPAIVYCHSATELRSQDINWQNFLVEDSECKSVPGDPMNHCNILFSSGTTAEPKAISWNHTTAIKAASDAFFHHNIKAEDTLCWPTNLGWMMGPWLIFAALINKAAIALYTDAPKDRAFGEFIEHAKVTMLGVVPTLVATWRQSKCMEKLNWHSIKAFSSTGECSNPEDMLYLMSLAAYKPIIEYCGGTEIGGAYVTSTVIEKNYPALFSTPAMGIQFEIIDEDGQPADIGEVGIIPPSLGLSTELLNADHHKVYFANMPTVSGKTLRRHGDQIKRLANGYFMILGRADDTMNLGGIKVSAAEIEREIVSLPEISEAAAIAVSPPDNGPSLLVVYATTNEKNLDKKIILKQMQKQINTNLNPLFKIQDVIFINELPKTASNKIMRRMLRKKYAENS